MSKIDRGSLTSFVKQYRVKNVVAKDSLARYRRVSLNIITSQEQKPFCQAKRAKKSFQLLPKLFRDDDEIVNQFAMTFVRSTASAFPFCGTY